MTEAELYSFAKELSAPFELLKQVAKAGRLPVVMFSAGGIATPADAAVRSSCSVANEGEADFRLFLDAAHDAARLRWSLCVRSHCLSTLALSLTSPPEQRLRHLRVLEPCRPRQGDRRRHHSLQRSPDPRRRLHWTRTRNVWRGQVGRTGSRDDCRQGILVARVAWKVTRLHCARFTLLGALCGGCLCSSCACSRIWAGRSRSIRRSHSHTAVDKALTRFRTS